MRKHNIHTHTQFSDGIYEPEELIEKAKESELEVIGISDHGYTRKMGRNRAIDDSNIERYIEKIGRIKELEKNIDVLIGLEIDLSQDYGIDPMDLNFDMLNNLDYVLFEYVHTSKDGNFYVGLRNIRSLFNVMVEFDIPVGLAHNDLGYNFKGNESWLTKKLSYHDIFVEINQSERRPDMLYGRNTRDEHDYFELFSPALIRKLKPRSLLNLGGNDIKVVCGTDSHVADGLDSLDRAYAFIGKHGLNYHSLVK